MRSIASVLRALDLEHTPFQVLDENITNISTAARGGVKVTFTTGLEFINPTQMALETPGEFLGLVLWVRRADYDRERTKAATVDALTAIAESAVEPMNCGNCHHANHDADIDRLFTWCTNKASHFNGQRMPKSESCTKWAINQ
jgi:hypothetical protein